ncbi:MAG: hypothetical protein ABIR46_02875 [Candidatus Saccharimonadales bacterium]
MANTESHVTGFVDRIHTSLLLTDTHDAVRIGLSSQEKTLAQIELRDFEIRRSLGRKVLHLQILDLSGMPEHLGRDNTNHLKVHLGHTVLLGRGRLNLPVFESESVSENHVELSFGQGEDGYQLSINDYKSANGSHLVDPLVESTWEDKRRSYLEVVPPHFEEELLSSEDSNYDFLYAPKIERYGKNSRY